MLSRDFVAPVSIKNQNTRIQRLLELRGGIEYTFSGSVPDFLSFLIGMAMLCGEKEFL